MTDQKTTLDTRERILDVAERLFMENGYEGTSMRVITGAAEVNLAAVNYHFGSKEALLREVFRRRLAWLNHQRLEALDRLEEQAAGAPLKPSQILEAFFGTLLRMGEDPALGGMTFLRLLGRTLTEPAEFIRTFFAGEYAQVIDRYKLALFGPCRMCRKRRSSGACISCSAPCPTRLPAPMCCRWSPAVRSAIWPAKGQTPIPATRCWPDASRSG
jgi:AcrR family transcriptional regulator